MVRTRSCLLIVLVGFLLVLPAPAHAAKKLSETQKIEQFLDKIMYALEGKGVLAAEGGGDMPVTNYIDSSF